MCVFFQEELVYLKSFDHPNIMSSIRVLVSGVHLCIMSPLMDYGKYRMFLP
jgi:hypothetical protein